MQDTNDSEPLALNRNQRRSIARHVEKNKNKKVGAWDDLKALSDSVGSTIETAAFTFCEYVDDPEAAVVLKNSDTGVEFIRGVQNDLLAVKASYDAIKAKHDGKVGPSKSVDDHTQSLVIGVEYHTLADRVTLVMQNSILIMKDMLNNTANVTKVGERK